VLPDRQPALSERACLGRSVLDALTKKPGALAGSTALEQCRAQGRWPPSYDQFGGVLKEREGRQAGTRAMIDVLLLGREYGAARVRRAVEAALELGCSNVWAIHSFVLLEKHGHSVTVAGVP